MKRLGLGVASLALVLLSACGSGDGDDGAGSSSEAAEQPTRTELGKVSSVVELRDALMDAGYDCTGWTQENVVDLAAESGSCDDSDVFSTFASEGDLQAQLDISREMGDMLADADVEANTNLVGPNWIFSAPTAGDYAEKVGGTIVGPRD